MYYTQEQIDRANQADLVSFLQSQGEQLTRAGNEYRWKRHDSLTVRGNKWYRHSQSKGGAPVDFVMEFFGKSFTEAVEMLTGEKGATPPPDRPSPASFSNFRLPPHNPDNLNVIHRPELSPEYSERIAESGEARQASETKLHDESLDIFLLQQRIAHENGLRTTIEMTYASLFSDEAVSIAKEHHERYGDEIGLICMKQPTAQRFPPTPTRRLPRRFRPTP